jgi:hypothetical protein
MKNYDIAKRTHKIGMPSVLKGSSNWEFSLEESSKDILREGARLENMINYSNVPKTELINFLKTRDIYSIALKLLKSNQQMD